MGWRFHTTTKPNATMAIKYKFHLFRENETYVGDFQITEFKAMAGAFERLFLDQPYMAQAFALFVAKKLKE